MGGGGSACLSEADRGVNRTLCVSSALILSNSVGGRWLCLWEEVLSSRPASLEEPYRLPGSGTEIFLT